MEILIERRMGEGDIRLLIGSQLPPSQALESRTRASGTLHLASFPMKTSNSGLSLSDIAESGLVYDSKASMLVASESYSQ
jgi:hypothetical protein